MTLNVFGQTDVGLKREINQDSILIDDKLSLYIVADGMGGHKGGEVASALAVETTREMFENKFSNIGRISPKDLLILAYREASARIHTKSTIENPELMGMGTTMVSAFRYKDTLFLANVGDSRAYLFADDQLWLMTEDHSLVNEQIKAGVIREEDAEFVAGRNVITRSVGFEQDVEVDVIERPIRPGDLYLLCSDGLSGMVSHEQMVEMCRLGDPKKIVPECIEQAKNGGGDDNISVLVLKVEKGP